MRLYRYCLCVLILLPFCYIALAEEDWMPDDNLRQAVRDQLELPVDIPLTQLEMKRLVGLEAHNRHITDLTGLEFATNLTWTNLGGNEIYDVSSLSGLVNLRVLYIWGTPLTDISPLAKLTQMEVLHLAWNQIVDITPLANLVLLEILRIQNNRIVDISPLTNLTRMKELILSNNQISDISPLANLVLLETLRIQNNRIVDIGPLSNFTQMEELILSNNQISDVSPLANLVLLETLHIQNNRIVDFSFLQNLNLAEFLFDEICELDRFPVQERIKNRRFPSVFQPWEDILNRPDEAYESRVAFHDLSLRGLFGLKWQQTDQGVVLMGDLSEVREHRDSLLALNSDLIFITSVHVRDSFVDAVYPKNYPHWVRNESGTPVAGWPGAFLLDFTHPAVQDVIVEQARALSRCGIFDGIFLDWWREDIPVLDGYRTNETEQQARDVIIRRIREAVGEDFLILVNPNRTKPKRSAPYINGLFMETGRDYAGGYTYGGLGQIESTLLWAEENLRSPQINCLQGWSIATQNPDPSVNYRWTRLVDTRPDTPTNHQWVRVFTTMSLTHSNGYVDFYTGYFWGGNVGERSYPYNFWDINLGAPIGEAQQHYWYDFYDADLGQPVGEKAQRYENREGLFIREFTNGWAVYNRSGQAQEISLPIQTTGVASGNTSFQHTVPDLDGEMFLKTDVRADVNGDGEVNILDLVVVANAFGEEEPDLNGDGVVNIQDLVIVANAFGQ